MATTKPAAKKTAVAAKPAAGASAEDLLGTPAKKGAKAAAPAADKPAKAAKKEAAPAADKPAKAPAAKRIKEKVVFAEGEREKLAADAKKAIRGKTAGVNSKALAEKLGIATRKLRPVLYGMQKKGDCTLQLGASKVLGMTVFPAVAAAAAA